MATFLEEASGLHCRIIPEGLNFVLFIEEERVFVSHKSPDAIIIQMRMNHQMGHEKWDAHYPVTGGYRPIPEFDKWQPE